MIYNIIFYIILSYQTQSVGYHRRDWSKRRVPEPDGT